MKEIFQLQRVPKIVISNMVAKFTSNFWKELFVGMDPMLNFRIAYHPENDGRMKDLIR